MGSGIAQTLATAGIRTVCTDIEPDALRKGREGVVSGRYGFERGVARGKLSREQADAALAEASRRGGQTYLGVRVDDSVAA